MEFDQIPMISVQNTRPVRLLKICGKEYGADRPMKRAVNSYLKSCIESLLSKSTGSESIAKTWALVLDTEELLTTDALIDSGIFEPDNIIIPNPCPEEATGIANRCPGVKMQLCSTHQLFAESCSMLRKLLGDDGSLGLIFLDYNGRFERNRDSFSRMLLQAIDTCSHSRSTPTLKQLRPLSARSGKKFLRALPRIPEFPRSTLQTDMPSLCTKAAFPRFAVEAAWTASARSGAAKRNSHRCK